MAMTLRRIVFAAWSVLVLSACAEGRQVRMLSGENWWGLCSNFGRQMPFDEKTDFKCDLRSSSYGHQSMSLLVSDKGRVIWCASPVEVKIVNGEIAVVSDAGAIELDEAGGGDACRRIPPCRAKVVSVVR